MVIESELELNKALEQGKHVLMEGGQATMLDVDHGTYPFVTSSNPTAGGACVGSGIGPTRVTSSLGIVKAYTTRVGAGPFPTELFDKWGEYLQTTGGEVGVNTGRKRRCGWYDSVIARYASRVNGFTDLFLTKLDVLTGIGEIPICVAYDVDGVRHDEMPVTQSDSTTRCRSMRRCPPGTRTFLSAPPSMSFPRRRRIMFAAWRNCQAAAFPTLALAQVATRRLLFTM